MADELPVVASVVASKGRVYRAIIGLDYYMFSRRDAKIALDADLATGTGRWTALMGSVVSWYALTDAWLNEVAGGEDPGSWTYDGFRETPKKPSRRSRSSMTQSVGAPRRPIARKHWKPSVRGSMRSATVRSCSAFPR
jgi:hypothetical protein